MIQQHVYGPPWVVWVQPWGFITPYGGQGKLEVGLDVNMPNSMQFTAGIWSSFPGQAAWVQLIDSYGSTGLVDIDGSTRFDYNGDGLLDNQNPFGEVDPIFTNVSPTFTPHYRNAVSLYDSPRGVASGTSIKVKSDYTDYLIFCPSGPGSIYVTLGTTTWSVNASAAFPSSDITNPNVPGPTTFTDSSKQPTWQHTLTNP